MFSLTLRKKLSLFVLVFLILPVLIFTILSFTKDTIVAQSLSDLQRQREELQKKLEQIARDKASANKKLSDAKAQKSGVEREIQILTLEINEQQLIIDEKETVIAQRQNEIAILEDEVTALRKTLDNLDVDINEKKSVADKRLQSIYRVSHSKSSIALLFNAISADDLLAKLKYQNLLRNKDEATLGSLKADKDAYNVKKNQLESKKNEVQTLTDQIVAEKVELENAKNVLDIKRRENQSKLTQLAGAVGAQQAIYNNLSSEEKEVQNQIFSVQAQIFAQFRRAPGTGVKIVKGQYLGEMGCTGYCYGPHLHFFVAPTGGSSANPCTYLPSGVMSQCSGNGQIVWPMKTPIGWGRGFTGSHAAIDISARGGDKGIYSSHDGWLYYGIESCETWRGRPTAYALCQQNGPAKYAVVCQNSGCATGMKTGYWHLK